MRYIYTGNIAVAPGATVSWSSVSAFASSLGFAHVMYPVIWSNVNDFQWTDVVFQFTCPIPPCKSNAGSVLSQPGPFGTFRCFTGGTTWVGIACTAASWSETLSYGSSMNDVTIGF